jgi:hypothetical protein
MRATPLIPHGFTTVERFPITTAGELRIFIDDESAVRALNLSDLDATNEMPSLVIAGLLTQAGAIRLSLVRHRLAVENCCSFSFGASPRGRGEIVFELSVRHRAGFPLAAVAAPHDRTRFILVDDPIGIADMAHGPDQANETAQHKITSERLAALQPRVDLVYW